MIESTVINPLADFGILEGEYEPNPILAGEYKNLTAFRITPFGKGLLEAMKEES